MGSLVSAVIANLVMEDVKTRALASSAINLSFWKRYVDNVASAVNESKINILLQHLNSTEPSIQLTEEWENDGKLDTHVHRNINGRLETDVYHKPTRADK